MSKSLGIAKGIVAELKAELRPCVTSCFLKRNIYQANLSGSQRDRALPRLSFGANYTYTENKYTCMHTRACTYAYCRSKINYTSDF